ncbi:MAG: outer membrane beta-barrel protein [Acidobacteria bacterium]|nr:outer membrane beta-barrel protein [Acidobacteriota bacterium]
MVILLAAAPALAQPARVEVSALFGWTYSDGVSGDTVTGLDGSKFNRIEPKDAPSWGLGVGFNASRNFEVGFLFGRQLSKMHISGPSAARDLGNLTVSSYHPYVAFNFGEGDGRARLYVLVGAGATSYGGVEFTKVNGDAGKTNSQTVFSMTFGGGLKAFPSPHIGLRVGMQWTPTYIKTDATGMWCDPYWGCYVTGDAQYSNQIEINGGLTVRF